MNKKIFIIIIEYAWIAMGLFCLIIAIRYTNNLGTDNVWLMYLLAVISFGMFVVRRMQRKNAEKRKR